jgi:hypothetical protein
MNTSNEETGSGEMHEHKSSRRSRGAAGAETPRIKVLREAGKNLGAQLEEQVQKRPYVVIGAAAGLGFVAGSVFGSRLGQTVLAAAMGYFVKNMLAGQFGVERIQAGIDRLAHDRAKA